MILRLLAALLLVAGTAHAADTGFVYPTSCPAVTSNAGDNNGFDQGGLSGSDCAIVVSSNNSSAEDRNTGISTANNDCSLATGSNKDQHNFTTFSFGVPGGAAIDGIEAVLELRVDAASPGLPSVCVFLSWDGGATWTAAKESGALTDVDVAYTLGGSSDTWGRTWSDTELSSSNFALRTMVRTGNNNRDIFMDELKVKVYYTATGAACTPRRTLLGVGC
jgi:hypothetical protein